MLQPLHLQVTHLHKCGKISPECALVYSLQVWEIVSMCLWLLSYNCTALAIHHLPAAQTQINTTRTTKPSRTHTHTHAFARPLSTPFCACIRVCPSRQPYFTVMCSRSCLQLCAVLMCSTIKYMIHVNYKGFLFERTKTTHTHTHTPLWRECNQKIRYLKLILLIMLQPIFTYQQSKKTK